MTTVGVDGGEIELAWSGRRDPARLPVVLLHEGLGSVSLWRDFPEALSAHTRRQVMAYSRFGHGGSSPPPTRPHPGFMHEEAQRLPTILDAAGLDRVILLGHSDGGSIALLAAASCPDRIEGLVLEAPHVFVEDISVATITERAAAYRDPTDDLRRRLSRHHRDVDQAFSGWSDVWLDPAFRGWNIEAVLPAVRCPVLLIQGEDDRYGTTRQLDVICGRVRGPCESVLLADCGHSPHRDRRDEVLSRVARFVRPLA